MLIAFPYGTESFVSALLSAQKAAIESWAFKRQQKQVNQLSPTDPLRKRVLEDQRWSLGSSGPWAPNKT